MLETVIYSILRKGLKNKQLALIFDLMLNIDIVDERLVLTFNKKVLKTFKNNILMNKDNILKIKTNDYELMTYKETYFKYEIKESIFYDSNSIHITILDKQYNKALNALKVLSRYFYESYNFKGLNHSDKETLKSLRKHHKQFNSDFITIETNKNYYSNDIANNGLLNYDSVILDQYNSCEYSYNNYRYYYYNDITINYESIMSFIVKHFINWTSKNKKFYVSVSSNGFFLYKRNNDKPLLTVWTGKNCINYNIISNYLNKNYKDLFDLLEAYECPVNDLKAIDKEYNLNIIKRYYR